MSTTLPDDFFKWLVELRRWFHRFPEPAYKEVKTAAKICETLDTLKVPFQTGVGGTGVVAKLSAKRTGHVIAFRTDMDALTLEEKNDVPYKSRNPGFMHACGHDGHMTIALGIIRWLIENRWPQNGCGEIVFIFQPAEEGPGGAFEIIKTGILEKYHVSEVYGLHLFPNYPEGTVVAKSGPLMASITLIDLIINGVSSHVAMPNEGVDALYYGALFYADIVSRLSESLKSEDYIFKFGKMTSGTVRNIVSNLTSFEGTIRTFSNEIKQQIIDIIQQIKTKYEQLYGLNIEIHFEDLYPSVNNDVELFNRFKAQMKDDFVFEELPSPLMISEDFSFYQQEVRGVFYFLGTNNPDLGFTYRLHNDRFNFNEDVLQIGIETFKKIIKSYK